MRVFVNSINGETITCTPTEETVNSVKEAILEVEGFPVDHQRLVFEGKEMEDGRSLSYYNVTENSTLHLMLQLPGARMYRRGPLWKLANYYVVNKKICRKCYGRLPTNAVKCRKPKCGRTHDIRCRKTLSYNDSNRYPKKFGDWDIPIYP